MKETGKEAVEKQLANQIEKELGVKELIKKASQEFITQVLEALPENPLLKKIPEQTFIASVSEIAPKVIAPPQITGEYPQIEVGPDWATITWVTDKKSNSLVALAKEEDYDPTKEEPYTMVVGNPEEMVTFHKVKLIDLEPSTVYHYQIRSKAQLGDWSKSEDRTFTTLSLTPEISDVKFLEITENTATISWATNLPTKARIEITNLRTGEKQTEEDPNFVRDHVFTIKGLTVSTDYTLQIIVEDESGQTSKSSVLPFTTSISLNPPVISEVRISTALIPGRTERVQTIISWKTDKPATSRVFYEEGISKNSKELSLSTPLDSNLVTEHIIITTAFKPGKIYRLRVQSIDAFNNESYSRDYTILTPRPKQSVLNLIIRNFEETFGFIKKIKF
jgi:hypothetical protein